MIVRAADGKIIWDGPPSARGAAGYGVTSSARIAIGRAGTTPEADKREGDGKTPTGRYPFRRVLYRADRMPDGGAAPLTGLPVAAIREDDGWCDDASDPENYNRPVRLPYAGSHERMWREDGLYDIVVVIGHNDDPPVPGMGSAIFVHCASEDYAATAGCVALAKDDLRALVAALAPGDEIEIEIA